jgi:hypothetical protein
MYYINQPWPPTITLSYSFATRPQTSNSIKIKSNHYPIMSEPALTVTSAPSQAALDRVYEEFCSHIELEITPETSTQRGTKSPKPQSTEAEAETFNPAQIRRQLFSLNTEEQTE